jgi:hypothetical protein
MKEEETHRRTMARLTTQQIVRPTSSHFHFSVNITHNLAMVLAFFSFFPKKKRKGVQLHRWAMRHGLSWQVHVLLRANPSKMNISTTYKKANLV